MNPAHILSEMNNTWNNLLAEYYDTVADEHMKIISEKYDINFDELKKKSIELKPFILTKINGCLPTNKEPPTVVHDSNISSKSRSELQTMCKERGLKNKRKNIDMVNDIVEFDAKQNDKIEKTRK